MNRRNFLKAAGSALLVPAAPFFVEFEHLMRPRVPYSFLDHGALLDSVRTSVQTLAHPTCQLLQELQLHNSNTVPTRVQITIDGALLLDQILKPGVITNVARTLYLDKGQKLEMRASRGGVLVSAGYELDESSKLYTPVRHCLEAKDSEA